MAQTKIGECEVCPKTDVEITLYHNSIWFCGECLEKEKALQQANNSPEAVKARVEATRTAANPQDVILQAAKSQDASVEVRTDLFNAATTAIIEIKKAIDDNPEITNKPYALAEHLLGRFTHFKNVIFEAQQHIVEASNNQRAIQVYLNNMANTLRQEEREKLKIQDINYRPNPVKTPTVKSIKTTGAAVTKKASKKEIADAAKELGIAEFTLTAFVLQSGGDLQAAVSKIKASIAAAQQVK